ncbi:DUF5000 domain-containing lipoprotein [Niabella ginsengisoli]|uniref:DUF4959 domain-containing protein n=1 Tax=Niabella ginsengisoli TaxID=522298 RepID=A0ABS9SGU4_9BACT|nr:DUF5000 domain-containing lipoprotein [Niabella ginsengisoli]MCH5597572.1 DUF4959 domain-containing protein [Niabella ginsengisoli]
MSKHKNIYAIALLLFIIAGGFFCKRQDMLTYTNDNAPAPTMVTNIKTGGMPGGAFITYSVPSDYNLLYVKAEYEIRPGVKQETKVSYFKDSLFVEGFGDTQPRQITIKSIGRNGKESDPQIVDVTPLQPPLLTTFEELTLKETFGGAAIKFKNLSRANLAFVVLADSTGNGAWYTVNTFYSKADSGAYAVRGFDPVTTKFAVYIRDRWNNKSDTLLRNFIPLAEVQIDKSKFQELSLPNDNAGPHTFGGATRYMRFLWDNGTQIFHTAPSQGIPASFTFDMGEPVVLSRFKFFHREGVANAYNSGDPKVFEFWGSNNPSLDGNWASWDSIGRFNSFKPSGLPLGQASAEDLKFAVEDGEDFDMPIGIPPYRYLRVKILEIWGGVSYFYIREYTFWGAPSE